MKPFKNFVNKRRQSFQKRSNSNTAQSDPAPAPAQTEPNNEKRAAAPEQDQEQQVMAAQAQDQQVMDESAPGTLQLALQNKTNSGNVFAYITGLALDKNNAPLFVQSDGRSIYYPSSPSEVQSRLQADVAIPLGGPGNTVNVTIPKIAGGRIWFSIDDRLTFLLNPGADGRPGVVEPSVTNTSDLNFNLNWTFCEFTFNDSQLFANISYVDFVSVPVSLSLTNAQGNTQTVPGMRADGFQTLVNELRAQSQRDHRPWDQLIHEANGKPLRVLSPNNLLVSTRNAWDGYWDAYTNAVWEKYRNEDIIINTQAAPGNLRGRVQGDELVIDQAGSFSKPTPGDIFTCNTGPFATGPNQVRNVVIPRLAAAFNRSILLSTPGNQFPNGSNPSEYYKDLETTNHYSRIVHQVQKDGRGYAFPYDDVVPDGGNDVAGTIFDGSPRLFTIAVGGN